MKQRILRAIDLLMEIGWLAIFFFLPLFFFPFVHGSWEISETFLTMTLVEIICFLWLVKAVIKWKVDFEFKKIKFILPAVIFIFILGLAMIWTQSPYYSFWGSYVRKMGYLMWLHFFLFFLILFFNLKTSKQIVRVFYVIASVAGIVAVYGFLQVFGMDFFHWSESPSLGHRVFSTFGQPNFLASWLLLALPIILWLFFSISRSLNRSDLAENNVFKKVFLRPIFICLFLLSLIILVLTQSRGAWIGFFFASFFFIIIFSWQKKKKTLVVFLLIFFILSMVFLTILNARPLMTREGDNPLIVRLKTLSNLSGAGQLRLIWWKNSLDLIKQRPLLGYGPETQELIFAKYYQPEYAALEGINQMPDRAHNDFLDVLLISGILGLISYMFLIVSVFWLGLKYIFKRTLLEFTVYGSRFMVLVLLTGLFGYLISLQFSFHFIPAAAYFWAYLAIILKITSLRSIGAKL